MLSAAIPVMRHALCEGLLPSLFDGFFENESNAPGCPQLGLVWLSRRVREENFGV